MRVPDPIDGRHSPRLRSFLSGNLAQCARLAYCEVMSDGQASGTGVRERKKLATREALAQAALQLAIERGLENVRVEDITDAVNVSRRTFTNYFSCKEEDMASLNTARFTQAVEALRERPAGEPLPDALGAVFAEQYEEAAGPG